MLGDHPEWVIPSDVDAAAVLSSPHLKGCYGLKPIAQTKDYSCGAAAVATAMRWFGLNGTEHHCAQSLGTNSVTGTTWKDILFYLRRHHGMNAKAYGNFSTIELIARAKRGLPTLIEWLDWGGHWVLHVGYEPEMDALVFADPARPRSNFCCHSVKTFEKYWYAPAAKRLSGIQALAITVDLWRPPHTLRPSTQFGTQWHNIKKKRVEVHWHKLLYDWGTGMNWVQMLAKAKAEGRIPLGSGSPTP